MTLITIKNNFPPTPYKLCLLLRTLALTTIKMTTPHTKKKKKTGETLLRPTSQNDQSEHNQTQEK